MPDGTGELHIEEAQTNAIQMGEILTQANMCDLDKVIHAAKLRRLAEAHASRAKAIRDKLRAEVQNAKATNKSCKKFGVKNLSAAIRDQKAQALTCVARDRDTKDGGKKGQRTANPTDIDAVARRAWGNIYDGVADAIGNVVDIFMNRFANCFLKAPRSKLNLLPEIEFTNPSP